MASDDGEIDELEASIRPLKRELERLEEDALFRREYDDGDAVVTIHAGTGGTDAQDWTEILLRMYLRWADGRGFRAELVEASPGEEAGLKSADVHRRGRQRLRDPESGAGSPPPRAALARSTRRTAGTRRSPRSSSARWSPMPSRSRSTRRRSGSTPTVRAGRGGSTSTRPTRRCGSRTCRRGSSSSARTSAHSSPTSRPR